MLFTTAMNTDHMKTHFTSQTCIEFILFPINHLWISYMVTNWCVYVIRESEKVWIREEKIVKNEWQYFFGCCCDNKREIEPIQYPDQSLERKLALTISYIVTTCPVKFVTTCPSVIFLFAIGLSPPCLRYWYCWPVHVLGKKHSLRSYTVYCIEKGA